MSEPNFPAQYQLKFLDSTLSTDVLELRGEETLDKPYQWHIRFNSNTTLHSDTILLKPALLCLGATRTVYGIITAYTWLDENQDQVTHSVVLAPRLALLNLNFGSAIYQNISVPELIEQLLRRQGLTGADMEFRLNHRYPQRLLITQWQETELAFIQRLLAETGIWFRFEADSQRHCERICFADSQQHYLRGVPLPYLPPAGLPSVQEAVWGERIRHQVTTGGASVKTHRATPDTGEGTHSIEREATTTGHHWRYGGPPVLLHVAEEQDEKQAESADFYARLQHEQALNQHTRIHLFSNAGSLAAGQVLEISGSAASVLQQGVVITLVTFRASRGSRLHVSLWGIPYSDQVGYRPAPWARPQIYGTLPARIEQRSADSRYAWLDNQGRYRVRLDFDRSASERGFAYLWLRLQVPWAGACSGWHFPLLAGTEVAIGYEDGDPDRPYIAHALHDSEHIDVVTQANPSHNILRTAAGNELRMEDRRGREHITLSTPYSSSALHQGHIVDVGGRARGSGFELRSDEAGVVRAGKGLLITSEADFGVATAAMEMVHAIQTVETLKQQLSELETAAAKVLEEGKPRQQRVPTPDGKVTFSAPGGIAFASGAQLQLATGSDVQLVVGGSSSLAASNSLVALTGRGVDGYSHRGPLGLRAGEGGIDIQAQNSELGLAARGEIALKVIEDHLLLAGKKRITLIAGGSYLRLADGVIEYGTQALYQRRTPGSRKLGKHKEVVAMPYLAGVLGNSLSLVLQDHTEQPLAAADYQIRFGDGSTLAGKLDRQAQARHEAVTEQTGTTTYVLPAAGAEAVWSQWEAY